jgi:hypothetical protein
MKVKIGYGVLCEENLSFDNGTVNINNKYSCKLRNTTYWADKTLSDYYSTSRNIYQVNNFQLWRIYQWRVDLIIEFTFYVLDVVKKSKVAATIIEHTNI